MGFEVVARTAPRDVDAMEAWRQALISAMPRSLYRDVLHADPCAVCPARGATSTTSRRAAVAAGVVVNNLIGMCEAHNTEKADTTLLFWLLHRRDIGLSG